jgi:multidrug transporter EmrE-like cation transporter
MRVFLMSYGLIFLSALFDSYAAFIVKTRFNELGHFDLSSFRAFWSYMVNLFRSPLLVSAVVAFVAAPGLWFLALNRMDLSVGYPLLVGFHLLFVFIFGIFFLNESVNVSKLIGSTLVVASLYFFYKG